MKISDIPYGWITTIFVEQVYHRPFPKELTTGTELLLYTEETSQQFFLSDQNGVWPIVGVRTEDKQFLLNWYIHGQPQLVWLLKNAEQQLTIQIHQFSSKIIWAYPLEIGIDEGIVEEVKKKWPSVKTITNVQEWLQQQLFLEQAYSKKMRMFVANNAISCDRNNSELHLRIYGLNISADITIESNIVKIIRLGNTRQNKDVILNLLEADIILCGSENAKKLSGEEIYQLEQLANTDSYLGLWRNYNALERQTLARRAKRFGYFSYQNWTYQEGRYHFELSDYPDLVDRLERLMSEEDLEFETRETIPEELILSDEELSSNKKSFLGTPFIGKVTLSPNDIESKTIVLEPIMDDDGEPNLPPKHGYLFYTIFGDSRRLERRNRAEFAIRTSRCYMPQLGAILEGKATNHAHSRIIPPVSLKLLKNFPTLTYTQQEAIRIALNTPDIALIQGPPGTGKTTVINAIIHRIAEISKDASSLSGLVLLTSYQHEAVSNAADRIEIYGIPAMKVGQKRGESIYRESQKRASLWSKEKIESIQNKIAQYPIPTEYTELKSLVQSYILSPEKYDTIEIIEKAHHLAGEWIPITLRDKLQEYKINLKYGIPIVDVDVDDYKYERILTSLRLLPTKQKNFAKHGALYSAKLLQRLLETNIFDHSEISLLEKASHWFLSEPPPFLQELENLKGFILKKLQIKKSSIQQLCLIETQKLLTEILEAMAYQLGNTPHSRSIILQNYIYDLKNDLPSLEQALIEYTTVLGATCQQSASKKIFSIKENELVYDSIIVDEAARANPLDLFIPMAQARQRIILVGDHRQLPQMLEPDLENDSEMNVPEEIKKRWHESLFERLFLIMKENERKDGIRRTITLDTQYRMHPILGDFVSKQFYEPHGDGKIQSGTLEQELKHDLCNYVDPIFKINKVMGWIEVPFIMGSEQKGQSKSRTVEARRIAQELQDLMSENKNLSFGIISFYSAQIKEIQRQLSYLGMMIQTRDGNYEVAPEYRYLNSPKGKSIERLRVGTVDAFQGREFDVVLLSMTRSNSYPSTTEQDLRRKYGHLMLQNRLCVAMSRQKRLLIVVGDSNMLKVANAEEVIRPLVEFYRLCGGPHGCRIY